MVKKVNIIHESERNENIIQQMLENVTTGESVWIMYKNFLCISGKISLSVKIIKNKIEN